MKNLNNTTRGLTFSFCFLMAIFFIYGVYSIYEVRHISNITRTIYSHPLVVSNAALHAKASITKMHLNMKDVVLFHSSSKSQQYIEAVNEEEEQVYQQLNIIEKNILGDDGKALESAARKLFDEWRPIRTGVVELVKQNQIENAANITIGTGANHVARLNLAVAKLTNFALDKASLFVAQVDSVNDEAIVITIGFLLISMAIAGLVASLAVKKASLAANALRESVEKYRGLIANLDVGIVVHAPDTSIITNNLMALELLGLSELEIKGKVAIDLDWKFINEDNTPLPLEDYPVNRILTSKKPFVTQILGIHRPETKDIVWVTVSGFPMCDSTGSFSEIVISFFDVTERKQAEKERDTYIAQLEAQRVELERFTYTVSHDLKSPIITINGFLGMLAKDFENGNTERIHSDINRIRAAATKMGDLLEDLLDLSKIGRIANELIDVSLDKIAHEVIETLHGPITESGVRLEFESGLPIVRGDYIQLHEVLQNLVENAIKYMGDQTSPSIKIGSRIDDGETVCYVRDNGQGIDRVYADRIFGLFEQLDGNIEGTGIGLALVKRIIEHHGGRIWVESEGHGCGSTFCFSIPLKGAS